MSSIVQTLLAVVHFNAFKLVKAPDGLTSVAYTRRRNWLGLGLDALVSPSCPIVVLRGNGAALGNPDQGDTQRGWLVAVQTDDGLLPLLPPEDEVRHYGGVGPWGHAGHYTVFRHGGKDSVGFKGGAGRHSVTSIFWCYGFAPTFEGSASSAAPTVAAARMPAIFGAIGAKRAEAAPSKADEVRAAGEAADADADAEALKPKRKMKAK